MTDTAARWAHRTVAEGEVDPRTLRENPRNWRVHPRRQQDAMRVLLGDIGWVQPVLVNQRTGVVVDGHMRVAVALRNDQATVPVRYVDLTDEEEATVLATLNPLGTLAYEDRETRDALEAQADRENDALAILAGDESTGRDGMTRDHTTVIAEGDDLDDVEDAPWAEGSDAYMDNVIRLMAFIMTVPEYEAIIPALERIGEREQLETNAETVTWLVQRYAMEDD